MATNQVLYNPSRRGIEFDLLPHCQSRGISLMAYSPIEQGRILNNACLQRIANKHRATPAQVSLAWVMRWDHVIAIPKAVQPGHLAENRAALAVQLDADDLAAMDRAFAPPKGPQALEML